MARVTVDAKDVISNLKAEVNSGSIAATLIERCDGLTPALASIMVAGVIAKAITFGYTIPSVIEEYVQAWQEEGGI